MTPSPTLPPDAAEELGRAGYTMVRAALVESEISALVDGLERLWATERDEAGNENYIEPGVRRLANLAAKNDRVRALALDSRALAAARLVCGGDVRLSMLNARDVPPGSSRRQPWHVDTDGGAKPDAAGSFSCTAIWFLDAATEVSGATVLLPGSHQSGSVPADVLDDLYSPQPGEQVLAAEAGDLLLFDGHCWHAGGPNRSAHHRRAVLVHYFRAGIPRRADRRPLLTPAAAAALDATERELLGLDEP